MSVKRVDNLDRVKREIFEGLERGLLLSGELVATKISDFTPVLTGLLKSQNEPDGKIEKTNDGLQTKVINKTEYGPDVEYGTIRQRPRAMFRQGGDASIGPVQKILQSNLPK